MNSYLDYPVCNHGANIFSAKAGYPNLNHGYVSSNSCPTADNYAQDGRLVAANPAPLHPPSLHQTQLDLQFPLPGNPMYGSPLEFGHHQYGLAPDQDRSFIHAQLSPNMAPFSGDGCGPAAGASSHYLHPSSDQRQQEFPENVYARVPAQCREKDVEETSKTFDWMKVKRNPPKTALYVCPPSSSCHSSSSLYSGSVGVWGSRPDQRHTHQLHHQAADGAGERVPLQQVPDARAADRGRSQLGFKRNAGENLVSEPQDEAKEAGEARFRFGKPLGLRGEGSQLRVLSKS